MRAVEVRLGTNNADSAIQNLLRLEKTAANSAARSPKPSFMFVLAVKTDYQYKTSE